MITISPFFICLYLYVNNVKVVKMTLNYSIKLKLINQQAGYYKKSTIFKLDIDWSYIAVFPILIKSSVLFILDTYKKFVTFFSS